MKKSVQRVYINLVLSPIVRFLSILFTLLGIVGLTIIIILLINSDLDWSTMTFPTNAFNQGKQLNSWIPYMIPGIMATLFFLIGIILLLRYNFKKKRLLNMVKHQTPEQAKIIQNIQNFHVTVNNVPRREITFEHHTGARFTFKFFGESMARQFQEGRTIAIITDGEQAYPTPEFFEQFTDR